MKLEIEYCHPYSPDGKVNKPVLSRVSVEQEDTHTEEKALSTAMIIKAVVKELNKKEAE